MVEEEFDFTAEWDYWLAFKRLQLIVAGDIIARDDELVSLIMLLHVALHAEPTK